MPSTRGLGAALHWTSSPAWYAVLTGSTSLSSELTSRISSFRSESTYEPYFKDLRVHYLYKKMTRPFHVL